MSTDADKSLGTIMEDLRFYEVKGRGDETTISIWVPVELKDRYTQIQRRTKRQFASKLRDIVEAAIEKAEQRAG